MGSQFTGRTAIVTGAGSGIGRAIALELGAEGANVVVSDVSADGARRVADEIVAAGGQAIPFAADVARHEEVKATVDIAVERFGGLHFAVNNAGIGGPLGPLPEIGIDDYKRLMDVNLHSVFYGMHYQIPAILKAGGGAIVNMASILGMVGDANAGAYVAAKHGVVGLTKSAALAYADQGVRINSVHPGYIDTPLLDALPREAYGALVGKHPIGRLGTSEEVSALVVFLLSDRASFITGSQHLVDGAYTAL